MQIVGEAYLVKAWGPGGHWCPDMSTVMRMPALLSAWEGEQVVPPPVARAQAARSYGGMIATRDEDEELLEREGWGLWWAGVMAESECHADAVKQVVTGGR